VYFSSNAGGYMCLPPHQANREAPCIEINGDNITLNGDPQKTRIWTRGAYSLSAQKVFRGKGVVIASDHHPHSHITITNLWFDGSTRGYSGLSGTTFPANPQTGDGWDIEHQGITG